MDIYIRSRFRAPNKLHLEHSNYPLAPEKINIQKEWLSDYHLEIANEHNVNIGTVKKLVPIVWMKPDIDFNTQKRKEATNDPDKNLFKLLNNAVYGKTMEYL